MHKGLSFVFGLVLLFSTSCASNGCAGTRLTFNAPRALKTLTESVVLVTVDYISTDKVTLSEQEKGYHATGFSIYATQDGSEIITNQHVCTMGASANYSLRVFNGLVVKATFVKADPFADICMLRTKEVITPLSLATDNASRGERITVIGSPDAIYPVITDGFMSGYYNFSMKNEPDEDGHFEVNFRSQVCSVPIYPGSSGSPVLNTSGEVVGIVFAGQIGKDHLSYIVPVSELHRFLDTSESVYTN